MVFFSKVGMFHISYPKLQVQEKNNTALSNVVINSSVNVSCFVLRHFSYHFLGKTVKRWYDSKKRESNGYSHVISKEKFILLI